MGWTKKSEKSFEEVIYAIHDAAERLKAKGEQLTPTWVMYEVMNITDDFLLKDAELTITDVAEMVLDLFVEEEDE